MEELSYRVRISALWLFGMIAFFVYRTIAVSEGATEVSVLSNGELAQVLVLMMLFAFLTLLLPRRANRLMNTVAGAIFLVAWVVMFVDGITGYPTADFNIMTGAAAVMMAAVIWLARRWPVQAAVKA